MGTFVWPGPEQEARKVLAPFFDLKPQVSHVEVIPFWQVPTFILMGMSETFSNAKEGINSIYTANARKLSVETYKSTVDKFDALYKKTPAARGSAVVLEVFSTAVTAAIPDDATAYPWRDAIGNLYVELPNHTRVRYSALTMIHICSMFQMRWDELDSPIAEEVNNFGKEVRGDFVATSGYPELSAYVNYAWGDETPEQIYGREKLPRLLALKKKWDPDNVFRYSNGLPTE